MCQRPAGELAYPIPLHRFLMISVATLARPDAAHDVSTAAERGQWNSKFHILNLNPKGRRQTKKYRPVVPVARQVAPWLDATKGYFVAASSVRSAWDNMAAEIGGFTVDGRAPTPPEA